MTAPRTMRLPMASFTFFVPLLSGVSWLSIAAMAYLNPSATVPAHAMSSLSGFILAVSSVCTVLLPVLPLRTRTQRGFYPVYISTLALLISAAWLNANAIHRDFFTYMTQCVFLYVTIFVWRVPDLHILRYRKAAYRALFAGSLVVFVLWYLWLMAMAYAIVTRSEPRWIEATVYNVLNGISGLLLLLAAGNLWERSKKSVVVKDGHVELDGYDISQPLSPQENQLLIEFLRARGQALTCARLRRLTDGGDAQSAAAECSACIAESWKPTSCTIYRHLKKQIAYAKKYLEITQIGTIVAVSANPREIKETGWQLRFFDDVRLQSQASARRRGRIFAHPRQ